MFPSNLRRAAGLLLLATATATLGSGCGSMFHNGVEAVVEFEEGDIAILPLAERELGSFESLLGAQISDAAIEHLIAHAEEVNIVGSARLNELFNTLEPSSMRPEEVADAVGASYYATATIRSFRTRDRGSVNMLHGTCEIDMQIWRLRTEDNEKGPPKRLWSGRVSASYPDEWGTRGIGVMDLGISEDDVRTSLIALAGRNLARKFYEHEPDPLR